jgi:hypothetical protein
MLLGHASLDHTTVYLHLSRRHMDAVHNPLDTLAITASVEAHPRGGRHRSRSRQRFLGEVRIAPCLAASQGARCHRPLPHCSLGQSSRSVPALWPSGQTDAIQEAAPKAQDMTCKRTKFKNYVDELQKKKNRSKSRVRAKVEHPFRILKRIFGFDKVRYKGIAKNHHRMCANFARVNLYLHRKRLAVLGQ